LHSHEAYFEKHLGKKSKNLKIVWVQTTLPKTILALVGPVRPLGVNVDIWDKVPTVFILCFGFWGSQTIDYFKLIWLVEGPFSAKLNQHGSSHFNKCLCVYDGIKSTTVFLTPKKTDHPIFSWWSFSPFWILSNSWIW
jgi:hypothetical protein